MDLRSTSPTGLTKRIKRLPPKKRFIKFVGRVTFWWLTKTSLLLRPCSIDMLGRFLGTLYYLVSARYRNIAVNNLKMFYADEMSENQIKSLAKSVFVNFAREAFQFFYLLSLKRERVDKLVDCLGFEHIENALKDGKGCIIITAHFGNWELLARKLITSGFKVSVIARDSDDPGMTGITTKIRENGGYAVFDRDQPIIGAFRALKRNECLGILPDQNDVDGIFVDFFGKPAKTATGPAVLSLKSGAAIVPAFTRRVANNKFLSTAYPRLEFTPSGDEEKDIHDLTQMITCAIEMEIRKYPSDWLWIHDRWKLSFQAEQNEK